MQKKKNSMDEKSVLISCFVTHKDITTWMWLNHSKSQDLSYKKDLSAFFSAVKHVSLAAIFDKTLGKNSSLSIIWHALAKYIGPSPLPPHTNVDNVMQNTVQAFGRF